jgi:outer membrane immunogenic protein
MGLGGLSRTSTEFLPKMKKALIATASLAAIAVVPVAAQAQIASTAEVPTGVYANIHGGIADGGQADLGVIGGRLGYRFNNFLGVEGELATGLKSDTDTIGGVDVNTKLKHSAGVYGVGFLPVGPNTDLLARVGYGTTKLRAKAAGVSASDSEESWNFGVGAQHHFDGQNGVRVDFTRQEFENDAGHANVWTVGYTRRF